MINKKLVFGAAMLSVTLAFAGCNSTRSSVSEKNNKSVETKKVAVIKLNNGLLMPQFGIGTFRSSVQEAHDAVVAALKCGYRHIDTAHAYQNERGVGAGVRDSGVPRSEVWITSKLWATDYTNTNADAAIDRMLSRLGTDYVDLVYLHQPIGDYMAGYRALERAVKNGKVRAIGLSNFDMKGAENIFDEIISKAEIKPATVQIELNPYTQKRDFREKCAKYGIAIEGWYPLGGTHGGNDVLFADSVILSLAEKYHKTAAQIILRWHVQEGFLTIPGSRNPAHIAENIAVYEFELSEEDMNTIRKLDKDDGFFTGDFESAQHFLEWTPGE